MGPAGVDTAVVLCGGRGTRLNGRPKALVEIGGVPIVAHVVGLFAAQGVTRVLLLTGHEADRVAAWAAGAEWPAGVRVECADTGPDTPTGGRVHAVAARLPERYFLTYGDGLAAIDLRALAAGHAAAGAVATVTVVRPELPFGVATLDARDRVLAFREKPRSEHWVNGGFLVCEAAIVDQLAPDAVLERAPLERLAAAGRLRAHRHDGFWACMDTYKDALRLNELWASGDPPWVLD